MNYLYKTAVYKEPSKIGNMDATAESANYTDFVTNYQATAYKVGDLELLTDTFLIDKTYAEFKALVDGTTITWTDVKWEDGGWFLDVYLLTDYAL